MFSKRFWQDAAERMLRAFLVGFLNAWLVVDQLAGVDLSLAQEAAFAGSHSALVVLLALVTKPVGSDRETASLLKREG